MSERTYKTRLGKFTQANQDIVIAARRNGSSIDECAGRASLTGTTLSNWLHDGKAGREPYVEFAKRFADATDQCKRDRLAQIA